MKYNDIINITDQNDKIKISENNSSYVYDAKSEKKLIYCIMRVLLDSGLSPKYKGYSYMVDAMRILYRKRFSHILITKDIYVRLAKMYNVSTYIIEHNIRNTIQHGWAKHLNGVVQIDVYSGFNKRPTNLEFLLLLVNIVSEKLNDPDYSNNSLWHFDKV